MNNNLIKKIDNLYYYQTDEFATIKIKHFFKFEKNTKNFIIASILAEYMQQTNAIYKTAKRINDTEKKLYGSCFSICNDTKGTKGFISFNLTMVDETIVDEHFFTSSIKYFKNMLLKPNFANESLDSNIFEQIKKDLISRTKNKEKNPDSFQKNLFYRHLLPNSDFINKRFNCDELESILETLTDKDVIDFYHTLLNNYITSYAFGNLSDDKIKFIAKSFKFNPIKFDYQYAKKEEITNDYKVIKSNDTTQTYLYVVYDIKNYHVDNSYIYHALMPMFNSMGGICHEILRDKLGLVYFSYADVLINRGLFFISAQIDKKNIDKALKGIDSLFEELKKPEKLSKLLTFSQEKYRQELYTNTEILASNLTNIERFIFKDDYMKKELVDKINSLTSANILRQIEEFEKKYIFIYEGEKDEN